MGAVEELAHGERGRALLADQAEPPDVLGRDRVLEEEEAEALRVLAEAEGLGGGEPLVDVVEELDLVAELLAGRFEELERAPCVGRRLEDRRRVEGGDRGLPALRPVAGHAGDAHLHAHVSEAASQVGPGVLEHLGDRSTARVRVAVRRLAALAAEELVDGHPGLSPLDVPERHVDAADGVVEDRPVPPVRARVEGLPRVLDPIRGLADEERLQVAFHRGRDEVGALGEGGAAVAVEPVLVGRDLDHDEPQPRRRGGDRAHVLDLRRRQAAESPLDPGVRLGRSRPQETRRRTAGGEPERLAPPHAPLLRPGAGFRA